MAEAKKKSGAKPNTAYKVAGDALSRTKKMCPRCGAGNFLAEHADRFHCGRCKYTLFKTREPQAAAASPAAPLAAAPAAAPTAATAPKKP